MRSMCGPRGCVCCVLLPCLCGVVTGVPFFGGVFFFFQAEDGIRDVERSRGLGDVYKRQVSTQSTWDITMKKKNSRYPRYQQESIQQRYASLNPRQQFSPSREVIEEKDSSLSYSEKEISEEEMEVILSDDTNELAGDSPGKKSMKREEIHFKPAGFIGINSPKVKPVAVSYTHLTLPTILLVQISVVAGSLQKKKR
eukprot:TRINITY_DN6253_c0_g1_i1.p1 TRINITY_DN6253_c0_g1~~TRINITY_DN6253_c0_g1_i1.p1  ORF type:complete len:197 (+),score=65.29 TRINITY_DN6253_c0_g1_i1:44-634(+)